MISVVVFIMIFVVASICFVDQVVVIGFKYFVGFFVVGIEINVRFYVCIEWVDVDCYVFCSNKVSLFLCLIVKEVNFFDNCQEYLENNFVFIFMVFFLYGMYYCY